MRKEIRNIRRLLDRAAELGNSGDHKGALRLAREAEQLARASEARSEHAIALTLVCTALAALHRYEEVLEAADGAVEAARAVGHRLAEADALSWKADALGMLDRYEEAVEAADGAVEAARAARETLAEANALCRKADALGMLDRYEEALEAADGAVEAARAVGYWLGEANALLSKADALGMLDRYEEALQAADGAVEAARAVGDGLAEANALRSKADALRMLHRYEEAVEAADGAVEAARAVGYWLGEANALHSKAKALRMLRRYDEALEAADAAVEAARALGDRLGEANALCSEAMVLRAMGKIDGALEAVSQAVQIAFGLDIKPAQPAVQRVELVLAYVVAQQGEERARAWLRSEAIPVGGLRHVPRGTEGVLAVLRGYASYAAAGATELEGWVGGGYFLWWRGTGVVIDPGSHFVDLMRTRSRFHPADISAIIVTHNHPDHAGDLTAVLSLLHELAEQKAGGSDENSPGADPMTQLLLAPNVARVPNWPVVDLSPGEKEEIGNIHVVAFRTQHEDLGPANRACRGLRFELLDEDGATAGVVAITSDTGWFDELPQHLLGDGATARDDRDPVPLLVIAHLGDIYEEDLEEGPQGKTARHHLGHEGVRRLFREIDKLRTEGEGQNERQCAWLGVVAEWGPALALREGSHAAILQRGVRGGLICPGVLGMEIALPQMRPICQYCQKELADRWQEIPVVAPEGEWLSSLPFPRPPRAPHAGDSICLYLCDSHDQPLGQSAAATRLGDEVVHRQGAG